MCYSEDTVEELREVLRDRLLHTTGTKLQLIERLEEDDAVMGERATRPLAADDEEVIEDVVVPDPEVPVGLDGTNPITPNNPAPKAVVGGEAARIEEQTKAAEMALSATVEETIAAQAAAALADE